MSKSNVFVLVTAVVGTVASVLAKIYPANAPLITAVGSLVGLILSQLSHGAGFAAAIKSATK